MELRLLLTCHCSHCCLSVQNQGGCLFGVFNYDSYVSFRAIGVIWGIWELIAELLCLLTSSPCFVPTLWKINNQDMKTIYTWTAREQGRLHGAYEQPITWKPNCLFVYYWWSSASFKPNHALISLADRDARRVRQFYVFTTLLLSMSRHKEYPAVVGVAL